MKFPLLYAHKKPQHPHKRMLLADPKSLIGHRICGGDIKLISVLGVGGHGVVYHAIQSPLESNDSKSKVVSSQPIPSLLRSYAVKVLSKVGLDHSQVQTLSAEFALHRRVSGHPNIVALHNVMEEPDFFFVLLDYVPNGDVFDMIEKRAKYAGNDALIKEVFIQLLDAVAHCHKMGVAHRDIKPENILCRKEGEELVLADFGLATDRMLVTEYGFGSEPYMAPQCFGGPRKKSGPYSTSHADIWSLGVVLVNLTCTRNPWHKATEQSSGFRGFTNNPDYLTNTLPISQELNTILQGIFALDPESRISLVELREKVLNLRSFTRPMSASLGVVLTKDIKRLEIGVTKCDLEAAKGMALEDDENVSSPLTSMPVFGPRCLAETGIFEKTNSESSESEAESEGPVTPETRAAPDVDIASLPEMSLEDGVVRQNIVSKTLKMKKCIPQVRRVSVRKMLFL